MAAEGILRNAIFAGASRVSSAAFTAVLTIFLVRYLGPAEYGLFALAMGVGNLITIPADLGVSVSAARFIAERRGDPDAMATVAADAIRLKLVVTGAASLALIALAGPIASAYDAPDLAWPLRVLALATFGQSVMIMWATIFEAVGRLSVYLRVVLAESALETTGSIVIVLLWSGATAAMVGRTVAYLFAAVFGYVLVARTLGRSIRPRRAGHGHARRILGYGSALVIVDGAYTIFSQIDVLLIGAILSVAAVGQFQAAYALAAFLFFIGQPLRSAVAPRLARGEGGPDHEALERTLRYLVLAQGVILAPLIVWAEPLTHIAFGSDYAASADVLRALAPFALLAAVSPLLAGAANYLGAARRRVPIALTALAVNAAIDAALLSSMGIVAGAIGTDVAYVIYVGAHLWLCREIAGLRLRPLVAPLAGSMAAAGVMCLVLLAFGTGADLAVPLVVIGGALGTAAYVLVLLATGQVTREERTALWRRLRPAREVPRPAPHQPQEHGEQ
jgi:O-antigen/teichoic acid export membrane protein